MNADTPPEVPTAAGLVRGRREAGLEVFRGIPFAQPPVGEQRFAAPQPVHPWEGVRDAAVFGPPPPQVPMFPALPAAQVVPAGDDWLTVNVWTPAADVSARRPVMVWIYGGAYKSGHADEPSYEGGRLARDGQQVVVSFNYRVGMEGFAQIEGAPANRGLLDQVAALRWVRENITAFGGDPDQVTVFGESAGAGSIAALLAMPSAKGLFRRAIVQSAPGTILSNELATDISAALAAELGLRPTVGDLSTVDPRKLTEAGVKVSATLDRYVDRWGTVAYSSTPFWPVLDGTVLPTTPWEALARGAGTDVDLVIGHNRDEYRLFTILRENAGAIDRDLLAGVMRVCGPGPDAEQHYRAAFPDATDERLYELVQSDRFFRMPSLHLAEAQLAGGGRAHVYELLWSAPGFDGVFGACHFLDVPLTFGVFDGVAGALVPEATPEVEALSAHIRSAWTAFAATGDPGWPAYDTDRRLVHVLDVEPSVTAYPEQHSRRLWQHFTFDSVGLTSPSA
ncbi:carboxylesterase family protein [Streptomyces sp. VNUA24]|uniref:carboxylesterase/lipase family protein n=1 Tax=Streptomyces sp. VNUA24 TaxID=3031131 RepID=UPI0023B7C32A|nr:carboxylesterase family protein [Streptomyces sp. VNUA24]WEH19687.1 carboxylesterase family protein [Streptomyces sp. VNUA24]